LLLHGDDLPTLIFQPIALLLAGDLTGASLLLRQRRN
jgi:hypothetical protein